MDIQNAVTALRNTKNHEGAKAILALVGYRIVRFIPDSHSTVEFPTTSDPLTQIGEISKYDLFYNPIESASLPLGIYTQLDICCEEKSTRLVKNLLSGVEYEVEKSTKIHNIIPIHLAKVLIK